ncbi:MAG TPA: retropepsin-like aspartic protease [bacterium]|nr:retropepsin-like aspartic protease [bacterium]
MKHRPALLALLAIAVSLPALPSWIAVAPVYRAPIHFSPDGLALTPVRIDGAEVTALIDSGTPRTIQLSATLARTLRIALADTAARARDGGGTPRAVKTGHLHTLSLGNYSEAGPVAEVVEGSVERIAQTARAPVEVVLGWGFLSRFYTVLDYPGGRWEFSDAPIPRGRSRAALRSPLIHGAPIVGVEIDGRIEAFLVDTGAPVSQLDAGFAHAPPGVVRLRAFVLDGTSLGLRFRISDLSALKRSLGAVGVLGNDWLRGYTVSIDPAERVITFD